MFRPRASSPLSVELQSAMGWPASTRCPTSTIGRWLMHVPWLRAHELVEAVLVELVDRAVLGLDLDALRGHGQDRAGALGDEHLAGVVRGARLHAGADDGRLGLEERHGLALHVRAHQGAVGVVVLEERDERGGHGHDLLGADVHVLDLVGARLGERVAVACRDALVDEVALGVELRRWPARRGAPPPRRRRDTRSRR